MSLNLPKYWIKGIGSLGEENEGDYLIFRIGRFELYSPYLSQWLILFDTRLCQTWGFKPENLSRQDIEYEIKHLKKIIRKYYCQQKGKQLSIPFEKGV